jgi:S-ribosylhomocysteine lyase LuxS involved in autoinducer biosynthesis
MKTSFDGQRYRFNVQIANTGQTTLFTIEAINKLTQKRFCINNLTGVQAELAEIDDVTTLPETWEESCGWEMSEAQAAAKLEIFRQMMNSPVMVSKIESTLEEEEFAC